MKALVLVSGFSLNTAPRLRDALDAARLEEGWTAVCVASPARQVPVEPRRAIFSLAARYGHVRARIEYDRETALVRNAVQVVCEWASSRNLELATTQESMQAACGSAIVPALIESCDVLLVLTTPPKASSFDASERYALKHAKRASRRVMRA